MWSWAVVVVLYLVGMGFFQLPGGLGGAADALERWGSNSASPRARRSSSGEAERARQILR